MRKNEFWCVRNRSGDFMPWTLAHLRRESIEKAEKALIEDWKRITGIFDCRCVKVKVVPL